MTIGWKDWISACAVSGGLMLTGCVGAGDDLAVTEPNGSELIEAEQSADPMQDPGETEVAALEQSLGPKLATALATPDEYGSYFSNGVGAFLSAKNNVAEVTFYVLPPAELAMIKHPKLLLVMPSEQEPATEQNDFEDVTLKTGQSHAYHIEAPGTLTQVIASFEYWRGSND